MPYYRTIGQVTDSYRTKRYRDDSSVINCIRAAKGSGLYNDDFERRVLDVANTVSRVRLKWFFHNVEYHFNNPDFDFAKCADLFLEVHDQLGPMAAGWFSSTYSFALEKGVDSEKLFYALEAAVQAKGKTFGARFVANLPNVLSQGVQTRPYVDACARIYELGGFGLLYPFTLSVPEVMKRDVSADEFAGIIEQADGLAGPAAARNLAKDAASVIDSGYDPWEILADARNVSQSRNTAGYYVSAFTRLVVSSNEIHIEIEGSLELDPRIQFMSFLPTVGERIKQLRAKREAINPEIFRENYESLLEIGQGAAVFHATAALMQKHEARNWIFPVGDDYKYFSQTPRRLKAFHSNVPNKTFWRAMWFVPKMRQPYRDRTCMYMSRMLDEIEASMQDNGQEASESAIAYTNSTSRRQHVTSLIVPRRFFAGGDYEIDYEPTEADMKFLDAWQSEE